MVQNCWEYNKCGKHHRADNEEPEICPTPIAEKYEGINNGMNGGRYCWRIESTLCDTGEGRPIPNWANKMGDCLECAFFKKVREEEGQDFQM